VSRSFYDERPFARFRTRDWPLVAAKLPFKGMSEGIVELG
jgi:hypothetical protein